MSFIHRPLGPEKSSSPAVPTLTWSLNRPGCLQARLSWAARVPSVAAACLGGTALLIARPGSDVFGRQSDWFRVHMLPGKGSCW